MNRRRQECHHLHHKILLMKSHPPALVQGGDGVGPVAEAEALPLTGPPNPPLKATFLSPPAAEDTGKRQRASLGRKQCTLCKRSTPWMCEECKKMGRSSLPVTFDEQIRLQRQQDTNHMPVQRCSNAIYTHYKALSCDYSGMLIKQLCEDRAGRVAPSQRERGLGYADPWHRGLTLEGKGLLSQEIRMVVIQGPRSVKEDTECMVQEAEKYKAEDDVQCDKVSAKNGLESCVFNVKSTVEDEKLAGKISEDDKPPQTSVTHVNYGVREKVQLVRHFSTPIECRMEDLLHSTSSACQHEQYSVKVKADEVKPEESSDWCQLADKSVPGASLSSSFLTSMDNDTKTKECRYSDANADTKRVKVKKILLVDIMQVNTGKMNMKANREQATHINRQGRSQEHKGNSEKQ
ncbi:hypothetical protein ABVT39_014483 [Epinephelus coioides]